MQSAVAGKPASESAGVAVLVPGAHCDQKHSIIRNESLHGFREFVAELGGDPEGLLRKALIPSETLDKANAVIRYRGYVNALEVAAKELHCQSFGVQLAARQGGLLVAGPLGIAMQNSATLGDAYRYCLSHLQVYSPAVQVGLEGVAQSNRCYLSFDILLNRLPYQRQAVEHAIGLIHDAIVRLTNGRLHPREIWFTHEPMGSRVTYQRLFGASVCFGKPCNAIFLNRSDLEMPLPAPDNRLYELATSFIDAHFPPVNNRLSVRVRMLISRLLAFGQCNPQTVARGLGLSCRTMQRRLSEEHVSFEGIKDDVRRDLTLRYLQGSGPFSHIAGLLGYSETSVLTRSCYRWFSQSPRKMRAEMHGGAVLQ
jgi:AraC-like DNA-binding protein